MSEKISWTLNVQVVKGPTISASQIKEVDAYDKIQVTVNEDANDQEVDIAPGSEHRVQFLLITSDHFDDDKNSDQPPEDKKLTYKVNGAGDVIKLDAVQLLIGEGAVNLLRAPPETLSFTNKLGKAANVEILVGRMATEPKATEPPP